MSAGHVVLSVSRSDGAGQRAEGHYIELSETGGVRLRPWAIRWATPDQLDAMAATAGLELEHRWSGWRGEAFDAESTEHVSVWRRSPGVG